MHGAEEKGRDGEWREGGGRQVAWWRRVSQITVRRGFEATETQGVTIFTPEVLCSTATF